MPSSTRHSSSHNTSTPWQDLLEGYCRDYNYPAPVFQIVSDRRGGRTAWSSVVVAFSKSYNARFWYDGKVIHNAKEDAAEVACNWFQSANGW